MSNTPRIDHRDRFYYNLVLESGQIGTHETELYELYQVLAGFFAGVPINATAWPGLTTVDKDGIETIQGWYGSLGSADYVARQQVEKGRTKGARAYACIAEYGAYAVEKAPICDDPNIEDDTDPEPVKTATLDAWGI